MRHPAIFFIIIIIFISGNVFGQSKGDIIDAWAIQQEVSGGAPPPPLQKPLYQKSIRVLILCSSNSHIRPSIVWIGKTPYTVEEEQQNALTRDFKPSYYNNKTNKFFQLLVKDSISSCHIKVPQNLLSQNVAVIGYKLKGKRLNFIPIKNLQLEHINMP